MEPGALNRHRKRHFKKERSPMEISPSIDASNVEKSSFSKSTSKSSGAQL